MTPKTVLAFLLGNAFATTITLGILVDPQFFFALIPLVVIMFFVFLDWMIENWKEG
jgi:hypothetical protein